ncbi:MAG TPA: hypothetical protein VIM19_10390 [Actinomycetes bacterium]
MLGIGDDLNRSEVHLIGISRALGGTPVVRLRAIWELIGRLNDDDGHAGVAT